MNSGKVLSFLNLLARNTSGRGGELAKLYQQALDDDDDILKLHTYLDSCVFYRGIGSSLHEEGTALLRRLYQEPSSAPELLPRVRQEYEKIEAELKRCSAQMLSPEPFMDAVTVLRKREILPYLGAMQDIAAACVHLAAVYGGADALKDLIWVETDGILEMIYAVNTKFLPALLKVRRPAHSWVIQKKRLGGAALFGGEGFFLSYEDSRSMEVYGSTLHKEPVGTHAWLNISAYEAGLEDIPYCWGTGNLVSSMPKDALSLLKGRIATGLRPPGEDELARELPAPSECIRTLSGQAMYCISPDELVLAMNRWQMGHEIRERKRYHKCLFCGKSVPERRLVCAGHFSSEL